MAKVPLLCQPWGGAASHGSGSSAEGDRGAPGWGRTSTSLGWQSVGTLPTGSVGPECCPSSGDSLASTGPFGRSRWVSGGGQHLELRKPTDRPCLSFLMSEPVGVLRDGVLAVWMQQN